VRPRTRVRFPPPPLFLLASYFPVGMARVGTASIGMVVGRSFAPDLGELVVERRATIRTTSSVENLRVAA
jgi:hypothetical protein